MSDHVWDGLVLAATCCDRKIKVPVVPPVLVTCQS